MTIKEIRDAISWLKENWRSPWALVLLLVLLAAGIIAMLATMDDGAVRLYGVLVFFLVGAVVYAVWRLTNRLPKASKKKVGFAVAIYTETKEHHEKIAHDFVTTLRELLADSKLPYGFSFV